ncbi:hypothetical protein BRD17_10260 [Halobacteriales archaeon SW_7_68_16]|nr:MAG: hypothetical protein BRD17_10260 [Halobacteriales archaeon SW_7_68_16]
MARVGGATARRSIRSRSPARVPCLTVDPIGHYHRYRGDGDTPFRSGLPRCRAGSHERPPALDYR